jgi:hypothetical protein
MKRKNENILIDRPSSKGSLAILLIFVISCFLATFTASKATNSEQTENGKFITITGFKNTF